MKRAFVLFYTVVAAATCAADAPVDVAKIVTKADAETVLGTPVRDPSPVNVNGADGYYSKVNYYSAKPGKTLIVRVRQAADGAVEPQQELEMVAASGGSMKPVEGLGDKAGVFNGTAQNGLPKNVVMLYVAKGKAFVTIGVGGLADENTAVDKARQIASKVLAQL